MTAIALKNQIKTVLLLGSLSALLIALGGTLAPGQIGIFVAIAAAMNLISYFYSDRIVLAMHRAHPIDRAQDPALFAMVAELADRAAIPMPRIYVIDDPAPNAFATGRNPAHGVVAVTAGIRDLLTDRELRGVLAHELAHIKNRDILVSTIAAMFASVISLVASVLQWGVLLGGARQDDEDSGGSVVGGLLLALVAPIAATLIQLGVSRSREYLADATGAEIAGDPLALASALAKLERGNQHIPMHTVGDSPATASLYISAPWQTRAHMVASWFSTHPPIEERIARLREMAGYGRLVGAR